MSDLYCTVEDIETLLSVMGVDHLADHDNDSIRDANVTSKAIERASAEIRNRLCNRYDSTSLAGNVSVNEWCTILAARRLTMSRANPVPSSIEQAYQEALETITAVATAADGQGLCGVLPNGASVPTFSNLTVDRRFQRERVRVVAETSSPIDSDLEQDFALPSTDRGRRNG